MEPLLPTVVAHRGASAAAPENTLAAFARAAEMGARWVECDVRLTADRVPVVIHDATLDRTTDGTGAVADRTVAAIARLDAGAWFARAFAGEPVPTLEATLDAATRHGLGLNVELKAEATAAARATAAGVAPLLAAWSGPLVVSSFAQSALAALAGAAPSLRLGLLCRRASSQAIARARAVGAVSLHVERRAFDAAAVCRVEAAGLWPVAYTVNDTAVAARLWGLGVRTLITDRPADLLAVAAERAPRPDPASDLRRSAE